MKPNQRLEALIKKYIKSECKAQEVQTLLDAFNITDNEELLKALLMQQYHHLEITGEPAPGKEFIFEQMHHKLIRH